MHGTINERLSNAATRAEGAHERLDSSASHMEGVLKRLERIEESLGFNEPQLLDKADCDEEAPTSGTVAMKPPTIF